jgi:hypothetical protein
MRLILTDEDAGAAEAAARPLGASGLRLPAAGWRVGRAAGLCGVGRGWATYRPAGAGAERRRARGTADRGRVRCGDLHARSAAAVPPVVRHFAPAMLARGQGAVLVVLTLPAGPDVWAEAAAGWVAGCGPARWPRIGPASGVVDERAGACGVTTAPALPRFMTRRGPAPVPAGPPAATGGGRGGRAGPVRARAVSGQSPAPRRRRGVRTGPRNLDHRCRRPAGGQAAGRRTCENRQSRC